MNRNSTNNNKKFRSVTYNRDDTAINDTGRDMSPIIDNKFLAGDAQWAIIKRIITFFERVQPFN